MLTNVSEQDVVLEWDKRAIVLKPGQSCRYADPGVERHHYHKHVVEGKHLLEHKPETTAPNPDVMLVDQPAAEAAPAGLPTGPGLSASGEPGLADTQ